MAVLERLQSELVGLGFDAAREGQVLAEGRALAAHHDGHAQVGPAAGHAGGDAEQSAKQRNRIGRGHVFRGDDEMPADDVAGLMRHDADHFVGVVRLEQQPGEDHHVVAGGGEGVDFVVHHHVQMDLRGVEAAGDQHRPREGVERHADLGVVEHRALGAGLAPATAPACTNEARTIRAQQGDAGHKRAHDRARGRGDSGPCESGRSR